MRYTMTFKPIFIKSLFFIVPYIVGIALSSTILPQDSLPSANELSGGNDGKLVDGQTSSLHALSFAIHRNGEVDPCGTTAADVETTLTSILSKEGILDDKTLNDESKTTFEKLTSLDLSKHEVDSILTVLFGKYLLLLSSCGPEQPPKEFTGQRRRSWGRGLNYKIDGVESSFLTFCDMGKDHTPILHDHNELVPVVSGNESDFDPDKGVKSLPCHFHTREGMRITSLDQFLTSAQKTPEFQKEDCEGSETGEQTCQVSKMMHLYAVPAGRLFVFAPSFVGETFVLHHVDHPSNPNPITLRVLSVSPRVFDLMNFFEEEESRAIVDKALRETSETHRIKRSSTGASGYNVNSQRTSENGFDTHGTAAIAVKQRSLSMLGFDEYVESYTDGLQVLRYNKTTAYIPHMDWIDDPGRVNPHDFHSAGVGTNRFATVLLYMTNLETGDGGETVFKHGWPVGLPVEERRTRPDVLKELRQTGEVSFLKEGSWEENMVADCRSRLSIKPHSGRAVLFYSQHPNGEEDSSSLHGGCPVLHGEKWAANNWVWNGPRGGFPGAPFNKNFKGTEEEKNPGQLSGVFRNHGTDPTYSNAKLFFQETFWDDFGAGKTIRVNTYYGHEWNVKDENGKQLKQFMVQQGPKTQVFTV
mmetsp:Transcript_24376/g.30649  ORF Transcript_24376/g.30649 Transcript_24376/m.30649 type:complete len:642 (+) Transcript_24376:200-2125(+)